MLNRVQSFTIRMIKLKKNKVNLQTLLIFFSMLNEIYLFENKEIIKPIFFPAINHFGCVKTSS